MIDLVQKLEVYAETSYSSLTGDTDMAVGHLDERKNKHSPPMKSIDVIAP